MTAQDWIAAAIALGALVWLIHHFRSMVKSPDDSCGSGCSGCGPDSPTKS